MDTEDGSGWAVPEARRLEASEALVQWKRVVRALGGLTERQMQFELRGLPVVRWSVEAGQPLKVELAKRPAQRPEWAGWLVGDSAALRKVSDELRRRMRAWSDDE